MLSFDEGHFLALIDDGAWEERELKERMHHTARSLGATFELVAVQGT